MPGIKFVNTQTTKEESQKNIDHLAYLMLFLVICGNIHDRRGKWLDYRNPY